VVPCKISSQWLRLTPRIIAHYSSSSSSGGGGGGGDSLENP